jgi:hypothetical protein
MEGIVRKTLFACVAASAALAMAGAASAADLVTNGGFESNTGTGQLGFNVSATDWSVPAPSTGSGLPNSYFFLYNALGGTTSGTSADNGGATGNLGNVALWGPGNQAGTGPGGGNNGLTLSPNGGAFVASDPDFKNGAISQTINNLVVGQAYNLDFFFAAAQQKGFTGATSAGWQVTLGGVTQNTGNIPNLSEGFNGWDKEDMVFTATNPTETLSFLATGTGGAALPPFALLDGVSLTPVPEPATWALMLVGVGALGAGLRMRRREVFAAA